MAGKDDRSESFLSNVLAAGKEKGYSNKEIAASVFAEVAAAVAPYSAALATIADGYLDRDASSVRQGLVDSSAVQGALGAVKPRFTSSRTYLGEDGLLNDDFFAAVRDIVFTTFLRANDDADVRQSPLGHFLAEECPARSGCSREDGPLRPGL